MQFAFDGIDIAKPSNLRRMNLNRDEIDRLRMFCSSEELRFIPHPAFESGTEFPDPMPEYHPDITWFVNLVSSDATDVHRVRPPVDIIRLTAAEEDMLFSRYNFHRRRLYLVQEEWIKNGRRSMLIRDIRAILHDMLMVEQIEERISHFNLGLCVAMAKKIRREGDYETMSELWSECNIALLRAIRGFDSSRGFKFSTYACRAMLKAMSRERQRNAKHRSRFIPASCFGREGSDAEERHAFMNAMGESPDELGDIVDSNHDSFIHDQVQFLLTNRLDFGPEHSLTDQERTAILHRFDPNGGSGMQGLVTLENIGEIMGVTKERVRQVINSGLSKIRDIIMHFDPTSDFELEIPPKQEEISDEDDVRSVFTVVATNQEPYDDGSLAATVTQDDDFGVSMLGMLSGVES
tara:strand:+ start:3406 stop:4626 length:1221 start_codon:yes stop_codon:yes gene_type:complete